MRGLSLLLLLLATGSPEQQRNDAGPLPVDPAPRRSEEDQEVIRKYINAQVVKGIDPGWT